jgi:zona occludens toxin (predicted ATPase)
MHNLSLMQNKIMFSVALLAIVASMSFMTIGSSTIVATAQQTTSTMEPSEGQTNATIVRDSTAFLLSGEIIPAESFIHL